MGQPLPEFTTTQPNPQPQPVPNPTPSPQPNPPNFPDQPPSPDQPPPVTPENPGQASELDKQVYGIFSTRCQACHSDKASGGLQLISAGGVLNKPALSEMVEIYNRVRGVNLNGKARMPKGSSVLSDKDVETIFQWVSQEASSLKE